MSRLTKPCPADRDLNSGELRAVLEACRLDLDSLRKDAAGSEHTGQMCQVEQGRLERRLCRVIERLEHMADTLDEMLDRATHQPTVTAMSEVLARETDHRIRNRLQALIALLERQALCTEADAMQDAANLAGARVEVMVQVHATLQAASIRYGIAPELDLSSYLDRLCRAVGRSMRADRKQHAACESGAAGSLP